MEPRHGQHHARRLKITPELYADVRRRFETTDEPLSSMASDLDCCIGTLRNLAKREGWVHFVPPPRELTLAARLAVRAEKLVHPPKLAQQAKTEAAKADRVEGALMACKTPHPRPRTATRFARGGGEEDAERMGGGEPPADTAAVLHAEVSRQLAEFSAIRAVGKRLGLPERERAARTLAHLTVALHRLQAIRCNVPLTENHTDNAYDDMPADLDEFRNELARRIDALLASPPGEGDRVEADDARNDEAGA